MWNLPFLRSAEPIRLILFGYLALAMVLALWLAAVDRSWLARAGRWALAVVAVAAIFADLPTFAEVVVPPPPKHWTPAIPSLQPTNALPAFFSDGLYRRYLTPGEIVVVVSHRGNAGMLFQADTGFYFRIDGGFINASLSRVDALPPPVAAVSDLTPANKLGFEEYIQALGGWRDRRRAGVVGGVDVQLRRYRPEGRHRRRRDHLQHHGRHGAHRPP